MDENFLGLRPAARDGDAREGLHRIHAVLDRLLGDGPAAGAEGAAITAAAFRTTGTAPDACATLRQRLAVRGWATPMALLAGIPPEQVDLALRTVGPETELAEQTQPGRWFLSLPARRRVFGTTGLDTLYEASGSLPEEDANDPVRLGLRLALEQAQAGDGASASSVSNAVKGQTSEVLQALGRMGAWGAVIPGLTSLASAAAARYAKRRRDRELASAEREPLIGRLHEQLALTDFLRRPAAGHQLQLRYVSGIGGSGKSALLLAVEQQVRAVATEALVIRMDFDSAYLDPLDPVRMDVMFLQSLVVELPELAPALQGTLASLENASRQRSASRLEAMGEKGVSSSSRSGQWSARVMKGGPVPSHGATLESVDNSGQYQRLSALLGISQLPQMRGRRVVLFLDTVENVIQLGTNAVGALLDWLSLLPGCVPDRDLRVVLAGRDGLARPEAFERFSEFERGGLWSADMVLPALDQDSAATFLRRYGMSAEAARQAAEVLPGNPLVLRLAAEAHRQDPEGTRGIQQAYREGRIDRDTASGYLAQRVVQHVTDPVARLYVVPAMVLPRFTERQLRDVVLPAVDGVARAHHGALARRIHRALQRSAWLVAEDAPGSLRWHAELRALVLKMLDADPDHAPAAARVRHAAAVWREGRRPAYPEGVTPDLDGVAGPLDETELHRIRLEGIGGSAGEGDRLVAQGQPSVALALYRERPTRPAGQPPTFVIRAIAMTGDWASSPADVDTAEIVRDLTQRLASQERHHLQRPTIDRLYWLTRLELLRAPLLSWDHVELLRRACMILRFNAQNGALFGLVAAAEALRMPGCPSLIAPSDWPPPGSNVGPELRFSMVRTASGQMARVAGRRWITTTLGAMLRLDRRWAHLLKHLQQLDVTQPLDGEPHSFDTLAAEIAAQEQEQFLAVERFMSACRARRVRVDLTRLPPVAAPLLRGVTVEFHSPLATLLAAGAQQAGLEASGALEHLVRVARQLDGAHQGAVLTLAEFEDPARLAAHALNLPAAATALVVAVDRAGCLPDFCRALLGEIPWLSPRVSPGADAVRALMQRFMAWDAALETASTGAESPPLADGAGAVA